MITVSSAPAANKSYFHFKKQCQKASGPLSAHKTAHLRANSDVSLLTVHTFKKRLKQSQTPCHDNCQEIRNRISVVIARILVQEIHGKVVRIRQSVI